MEAPPGWHPEWRSAMQDDSTTSPSSPMTEDEATDLARDIAGGVVGARDAHAIALSKFDLGAGYAVVVFFAAGAYPSPIATVLSPAEARANFHWGGRKPR